VTCRLWAITFATEEQPIGGYDHTSGHLARMAFGLNQVASQIGAHAMTPLHLLLFLPLCFVTEQIIGPG
jgi:hypothetical protein